MCVWGGGSNISCIWCILRQNARNIFYARELLRGFFSLVVCCVNCEQYKVELLAVGENEILSNMQYPRQWEGNGGGEYPLLRECCAHRHVLEVFQQVASVWLPLEETHGIIQSQHDMQ